MNTVAVTERVPARDVGRSVLGWTGALLVVEAGLLAAAFAGRPLWFAGLAALAAVSEIGFGTRAAFAGWLFGRLGAGAGFRVLLAGSAALILLARVGEPTSTSTLTAAGLVGCLLLALFGAVVATTIERMRKLPILVRGMDLAPVRVPKAPPRPLAVGPGGGSTWLFWPVWALPVTVGAAVELDRTPVLVAGIASAAALIAVGDGILTAAALAMRRVPRARFERAVERALRRLRPRVALYHAGGPDTGYQVRQWLETMERLDVPAIVMLRDPATLMGLGPTRLPVLCVSPSTVLMGLDLPDLRLVLYPAHATGNLHMLRRSGVRHVFIGHGDSDKPVTANPFLKAYDEVWVAGPTARERLMASDVGLAPERIIEVGRPQADDLAEIIAGAGDVDADRPTSTEPHASTPLPTGPEGTVSGDPGARLTVLYATTWEGYADEEGQTSVGRGGLELIERLVATPGVRVLYRPHPLLGARDPAVRRAHRRILHRLGDPPSRRPDRRAAAASDGPRARDPLDLAGPARAAGGAAPGDDVARGTGGVSRREAVIASRIWTRRRLGEDPGHQLVPAPDFDLIACFEAADVLLCDVSSVVTDFLPTGRPYGVINTRELEPDDFAIRYPSSRGGYLVQADGTGLAGLLIAGRGAGDPAAGERAVLAERLLGPSAADRFRQAVSVAVDHAGTHPSRHDI